jgi:hypothetical protein
MSRNLGALTYWNPVGLFRPVMGKLYLLVIARWFLDMWGMSLCLCGTEWIEVA